MSDWHRESCGPSDGVMVRLLSVIEGVRGGGVEVWPDKMNRSIKSGQDLNICISTESEPDEEKRPPWRGKLFDVWMSECVRPFAETHSWLHSFGQSLGLSHRSCWKTFFFSHFFPPCRLLGSRAFLQSGLDRQRRKNGSLITNSSSSWPLTVPRVFTPVSWGQTNLLK